MNESVLLDKYLFVSVGIMSADFEVLSLIDIASLSGDWSLTLAGGSTLFERTLSLSIQEENKIFPIVYFVETCLCFSLEEEHFPVRQQDGEPFSF